jgi:hypothetical protein
MRLKSGYRSKEIPQDNGGLNFRQQMVPEDSVDIASMLAQPQASVPTPEPPPAGDILGHPKEREEESVQYQAAVSRGNGMQDYADYSRPRSQIRLSHAEVEAARFSGVSVQEYAAQKAKLLEAKRLEPGRYGTKG